MADSDLGKTGAQKDGGGADWRREGGDNPLCPRFNSFSTSRVLFPFGPLAASVPRPFPPRFPRRVSRVPFIPRNVLHDRASEGNAPHRTHMAGLLSFTYVPFLVFPLLSNRWKDSKATGSVGKENASIR